MGSSQHSMPCKTGQDLQRVLGKVRLVRREEGCGQAGKGTA